MCSTACESKKSDDFPVDDIFEEIDLSNDETDEEKSTLKIKDK